MREALRRRLTRRGGGPCGIADVKITLRGQDWSLKREFLNDEGHVGWCIPEDRSLIVSREIAGKLELDTLIHEMLHACFPDLSEDAVDETSTDIARVLWRWGYRLSRENRDGRKYA